MKYFAGIDVSMEESSICVLDPLGAVVFEGKVATEPEAIAEALSKADCNAAKIGLEAGALSPWLCHELRALGYEVICLDCRQVHQFLKVKRNKTDRSDAKGIAEILRLGAEAPVHVKSYDSHAQRALLKTHIELVHIRQDLENTIRGILKPFGLRLPRGNRPSLPERVRELCRDFPELEAATASLLRCRSRVQEELSLVDKKLAAKVRGDNDCQRLMTVPSIGPITAVAFKSMVDDHGRFAKARAVGAYVGITPRRYQSGEVNYMGRISKRGDKMMRTLLYEAATVLLTVVKRFSSLKAWGLKLAKRIGMKKARVAVARKLAVIMAAILQDGTEFCWNNTTETTKA